MTPEGRLCTWVFVAAAAGAAVSLPFWRMFCRRVGHVDDPGHRKIHSRPVPLAGGFAAVTGWVSGALLAWGLGRAEWSQGLTGADLWHGATGERRLAVLCGATLGILLLGAWDDRRDLGPGRKLLGQTIFAGLVAAWGVRLPLPEGMALLGWCLSTLWILGVTNAFNLSDNMNGLCAGLGLIGAVFLWVSSSPARGCPELACAAAVVAGGLAGYLPYNYPRASVFLGDAGSQSVGFLMATLSLSMLTLDSPSTERGPGGLPVRSAVAALGAVAIPCIDLVFVSVARTLRGQPFWVGDTGHLSHRLARTRLGKAGAVAFLWGLAVLCAVWAGSIRP